MITTRITGLFMNQPVDIKVEIPLEDIIDNLPGILDYFSNRLPEIKTAAEKFVEAIDTCKGITRY